MNSSVWKSQEESRMENKSYFFGLIISRFLLFHFFRGCIGESISGWMTIACSIFSFFLTSNKNLNRISS